MGKPSGVGQWALLVPRPDIRACQYSEVLSWWGLRTSQRWPKVPSTHAQEVLVGVPVDLSFPSCWCSPNSSGTDPLQALGFFKGWTPSGPPACNVASTSQKPKVRGGGGGWMSEGLLFLLFPIWRWQISLCCGCGAPTLFPSRPSGREGRVSWGQQVCFSGRPQERIKARPTAGGGHSLGVDGRVPFKLGGHTAVLRTLCSFCQGTPELGDDDAFCLISAFCGAAPAQLHKRSVQSR